MAETPRESVRVVERRRIMPNTVFVRGVEESLEDGPSIPTIQILLFAVRLELADLVVDQDVERYDEDYCHDHPERQVSVCPFGTVSIACAHEHHVETEDSHRVDQRCKHCLLGRLVVDVSWIDE